MIDPANFACCEDFRWNLFFRGKNYLNSVVVNGQPPKRRTNSASWLKPNPSNVSRWLTGENYELVQGSHTLDQDLEHHRILFSVKNNYWIVLDYFEPPSFNQSSNLYNQYWYLTPGVIGIDQNGWLHLERNKQKFSLAQKVWSDNAELTVNAKIGCGTNELKEPTVDNPTLAPTVTQTYHSSGKVLSFSLLRLDNTENSPLINISRLPAKEDALVICLQFEAYTDYFYYNFDSQDQSKVKFGDYSFSGDFCHVRLNQNGKMTEVRTAERPKPQPPKLPPVLNLNHPVFFGAI
jgi:Heparinase II/III-like protein